MKTLRTVILIVGILVAGLALNTAIAQNGEYPKDLKKSQHEVVKIKLKDKPNAKGKIKEQKQRVKEERRKELKSELKVRKPIQEGKR